MTPCPVGFAVRRYECVDSTNSEAKRIQSELDVPTWIVARSQTAGRGRRNRPWMSLPGNLFATLAMLVNDPPAKVALRSFVAALAALDASSEMASGAGSFSLKWPNDLMAGNRKFAGILLECDSCGNCETFVRIGFGVNVSASPAAASSARDLVEATSFVEATGIKAMPEAFFRALAASYAKRELQFQKSGFNSIREDWLKHAAKLGESLRVNLPEESFVGTFRSIDSAGRAVIDTADGRRLVAAADIFY